jgi:hypothetical protein
MSGVTIQAVPDPRSRPIRPRSRPRSPIRAEPNSMHAIVYGLKSYVREVPISPRPGSLLLSKNPLQVAPLSTILWPRSTVHDPLSTIRCPRLTELAMRAILSAE